MTTEMIIILIFCAVDDGLGRVKKERNAKLYPSEVVTIGILFALKGGHFRAFYRWLKRDYDSLFGGLPERTVLMRQLKTQQVHTDLLMDQPSLLNVVDSFPIELIFPIRAGRSAQQYGAKSRDKGRWIVGIKVAWILNTFGQDSGWIWDKMNAADNTFLDYFAEFDEEAIMLADWGFRCADGIPDNVKLCKKG